MCSCQVVFAGEVGWTLFCQFKFPLSFQSVHLARFNWARESRVTSCIQCLQKIFHWCTAQCDFATSGSGAKVKEESDAHNCWVHSTGVCWSTKNWNLRNSQFKVLIWLKLCLQLLKQMPWHSSICNNVATLVCFLRPFDKNQNVSHSHKWKKYPWLNAKADPGLRSGGIGSGEGGENSACGPKPKEVNTRRGRAAPFCPKILSLVHGCCFRSCNVWTFLCLLCHGWTRPKDNFPTHPSYSIGFNPETSTVIQPCTKVTVSTYVWDAPQK